MKVVERYLYVIRTFIIRVSFNIILLAALRFPWCNRFYK
jgi:hypothetical protein